MRRLFSLLAALAVLSGIGCHCIHETCDCCPDICSCCCNHGGIYIAGPNGGPEELKKAPLPK